MRPRAGRRRSWPKREASQAGVPGAVQQPHTLNGPGVLGSRAVQDDPSLPLDYVSDLTTIEEPAPLGASEGMDAEFSRKDARQPRRPRSPWLRASIAMAALIVLAAVVVVAASRSQSSPTPQRVGPNAQLLPAGDRTALPPLSGMAVGGGRLHWTAFRGHVLVVNFWASWCPPCNAEQPLLNLAARQLTGAGVRFVGVDIEDQQAAAQGFRMSHHVRYPSLFDPADAYTMRLRAQGPTYPPFTLVVNRRGQIAGRILGSLAAGGSGELLRLVHLVEAER